ncbi:MAG TPA: hypothetical protein VII92_16905 [Anaerolineae bacterium]
MSNDRRLAILHSPVLWLFLLIVLSLPLLAEFNSRLALSRDLAAEEDSLNNQIGVEKTQQAALLALQKYIQSDEYVEHWARLARLAKPGEVVVVPVSADQPGTSSVNPAPSPQVPNDTLSEWWTALFGNTRPIP